MGRGIRHFIWGYQPHFRIGEELNARRIFEPLDRRFDPEVFLVGVLVDRREDRYPACVEPEDHHWVSSEAFDGVLERAKEIVPTYPESELLHTHPMAQKWHDEELLKRAVQEAITEVIACCATKPEGMRYFPSWPVSLHGFLVSVVAGLQEDAIDSHPRLAIGRLKLHECRTFKVPVSLIDAVTDEFIRDAAAEMTKPDPGCDLVEGKSVDEVLRAAGQRMMCGIAQRADTFRNQEGQESQLLDACNRIAAGRYERAVGKGRLLIARRDHPCLTPGVVFREPVRLHDARAARKLLELASGDLALHVNARDIWGLAAVHGYPGESEDLYEVRVTEHYEWELGHAGTVLMRVRDGVPSLPSPAVDTRKLGTDLRRLFRDISTRQVEEIISLADAAAAEKHGTMVVVSRKASEEADRLKNQGTPLVPCKLTPRLLKQLTPIDGAVLIDLDGTCHAIGVILDGLATEAGNPGRGARFNSAIRYVKTREEACMAIVVSEDGGVDLVPDLRPLVKRSDIEGALAEMRTIVAAASIDQRRYSKLADWLEARSFYLLDRDCQVANDLMKRIDDRLEAENPQGVHVLRQPFSPDPEFDPELYYEEALP